MAVDLNLKDIQTGFLSLSTFNSNNTLIEEALAKTLNRTSNASSNAMEVDLDMGLNSIFNVATNTTEPTSLLTVADADARYVNTDGDTLIGDLNAGGFNITNLGIPSAPNDAARLVDVGPDSSAQLRIDLADNATTAGSDLVAHTGTSDTVTEALDKRTIYVGSVAELESFPASSGHQAILASEGRSGSFLFNASDLSEKITADPFQGIYIAPSSDPTGSSGAWVRQYGQAVTLNGGRVLTTWFGAVADSGITNNTPIVNAAINLIGGQGGGNIHTPAASNSGYYALLPSAANEACIYCPYDNVTLSGDGKLSHYKTSNNADVAIHFSTEPNLTVIPSGSYVQNIEVYGLNIEGTGVYQNYGLSFGRGILMRGVKKADVYNNTITNMSMIGIDLEHGAGYVNTRNNQLHDNKYGSIAYNGRCYQSRISGNICSGSNGDTNTLAIQADGHCIITMNTIFGDITNPENCGGIGWGEGNYDGIGLISGNLIKHVRFGIKAVYHGSCNISGNTIINAITVGGITVSGQVAGGFTVANSYNLIESNLLINCGGSAIDCSAPFTKISNNTIRNFSSITNPSGSNEPDYIVPVTTQSGIRVRAQGCDVTGNKVAGCIRGLITTVGLEDGTILGNTIEGNTIDYAIESVTTGKFAVGSASVPNRKSFGNNQYSVEILGNNRPTEGNYPKSSRWTRPSPSVGSPIGELVYLNFETTAAANEPAGETTIQLTSTSGISGTGGASTVIGFELDDGSWHWTTVSSVSSPNVVIGAAIPAGRSVQVGAQVLYNKWQPLANL